MEGESKKGYWLVAIVAIVIVVAIYWALKDEAAAPTDQTGAVGGVCTQDVKRCADGSYVQRIAPTCEFAACAEPIIPNVEVPADWEK